MQAGELWSAYGVLSLSSKDKLYRSGEDYWRNLLAICCNQHVAKHVGKHVDEDPMTLCQTEDVWLKMLGRKKTVVTDEEYDARWTSSRPATRGDWDSCEKTNRRIPAK